LDNRKNKTEHGQSIDRAFLFSALQKSNTILLESSRQDDLNNKNLLFVSPFEILSATTLEDIPALFESIEKHRKQNRWIAGYVSYECGYHFENSIPSFTKNASLPLAWFGVYEAPLRINSELLDSIIIDHEISVRNPELLISNADYKKKIEQLKEYIVNGDTYQVNFTDRYAFDFTEDPIDLYFELRKKQHVPFGAYVNLGTAQILSFSPELFYRRIGNSITTKPMKGTCIRGRTSEEDVQLSEWLRNDEKNRSENLMIVDLLRNDIGRICRNGSVDVKNMYAIEKYETVLQMTSIVNGILKDDVNYYDIFKSLFPCGSVTGAPKIHTMQIINELEQHQRGVYCGAIGYIAPDEESVFSVAIRTLELQNGKGIMGVGSGIVYDSVPEKEYEECVLKASFLLKNQPEFQLLETILWKNEYTFLQQHLDRLKRSSEYFSYPFHQHIILEALNNMQSTFHPNQEYRVRLLLSRNGAPIVESKELFPIEYSTVIKIAPERTDSSNTFLYHKSTNRELYNRYMQKAQNENIADYIFLNERDEITEGAITNIFVQQGKILFTPSIMSGVLPGIFRGEILRTDQNAVEKVIKMDDLRRADSIFLCNSVRGRYKVTLSE